MELGFDLPSPPASNEERPPPVSETAAVVAVVEEEKECVSLRRQCSWCFDTSVHELVASSLVARSAYQCTQCGNQTRACMRQCGRMVRSYPDQADKSCFVCSGIAAEKCVAKGNCSWCLKSDVTFILYRARQLCRSELMCVNCKNMVNPCRLCSGSFARKQDSYAEERCLKCDGTISDWATAEKEIEEKWNLVNRWCSWCLEVCDQSIQQWRVGVKNVFKCLGCKHLTVPCVSCNVGMTRRNRMWKDTRCLSCSTGIDWEALQLRREVYFTKKVNVRDLLDEMSSERRKARKEGLERPFLLLCR